MNSSQRAGLELMDMMAVYQEGAYERLCRWVQAECRRLGDTDNPEVGELLKTAVRCLKERPVLFKYCAEEVANMRHNALFRRFISALTRGGPGGLPRPIEVHAHDPLRYALASERELVLVLLDPDAAVDSGPTARRFSSSTESDSAKTESDMTFVLDRIFEGASSCQHANVALEQISDLLGRETALCKTIWLLKDAAQQTFFDILKARGDKLLRYPPLVAVDLSPPPAVQEGIDVLLEIIDTYNGMMVPASGKKLDFDPVISAMLDPIVQMCERAAEAHKAKGVIYSSRRSRMSSDPSQPARDSSSVDVILTSSNSTSSTQNTEAPSKIFLINCLSAIQQPLSKHDVAAKYVSSLGSMIETHINILAEKEVDTILRRCGLSGKMVYVQKSRNKDEQSQEIGPLSEVEEMSPPLLSECLRSFFGIISGSEGSLPEFEQMQVPGLRSEAVIRVARALADAYELVYNAVIDPKNHYPEPKSLVRHLPDHIRTILGI
ncbi:Golgi transport complex subunit 6 [Asimina triloba]